MSFAPNYHRWILDQFAEHLGQRIAEVGAGCGNFSKMLIADRSRQVTAFEPSSNMFPALDQLAQQYENLETVNSILGDAVDRYDGQFDSIVYINVLEHIEDDKAELELAKKALKPGGKIIIFVPALGFLYSRFDKLIGHYRRYHKNPLVDLVNASEFEVIRAKYFDIAGILPWYLIFVLLKSEKLPNSINYYDSLVVPLMQRVENIVTPPVGKNVLLIATKR